MEFDKTPKALYAKQIGSLEVLYKTAFPIPKAAIRKPRGMPAVHSYARKTPIDIVIDVSCPVTSDSPIIAPNCRYIRPPCSERPKARRNCAAVSILTTQNPRKCIPQHYQPIRNGIRDAQPQRWPGFFRHDILQNQHGLPRISACRLQTF